MLQGSDFSPHCDQGRKRFLVSASAWPLLIRYKPRQRFICAEIEIPRLLAFFYSSLSPKEEKIQEFCFAVLIPKLIVGFRSLIPLVGCKAPSSFTMIVLPFPRPLQ